MKYVLLAVLLGFSVHATDIKQTTYVCDFPTYATQKGTFESDPEVRFTIVANDANGTYTLKGSRGQSEGNIILGDRGISFVKVTNMGNITTTTMALIPPYDKEQTAVHSRNILAGGKLLASQYYGTCQQVDEVQIKKVNIEITKEKREEMYKVLRIEKALKRLPKKDVKYVKDALNGIFPSRLEMEADMSIEGMILVSKIMDYAAKSK